MSGRRTTAKKMRRNSRREIITRILPGFLTSPLENNGPCVQLISIAHVQRSDSGDIPFFVELHSSDSTRRGPRYSLHLGVLRCCTKAPSRASAKKSGALPRRLHVRVDGRGGGDGGAAKCGTISALSPGRASPFRFHARGHRDAVRRPPKPARRASEHRDHAGFRLCQNA